MQTTFIYSALSILIGAAQIADAIALYRAKGSISRTFAGFAFVEYSWAGISLSLLLTTSVLRWLPLSFIVYVVAGVLYGAVVAALRPRSSGINLVVPQAIIFIQGLFGLFFLAASLYVVVHAWPGDFASLLPAAG